MPDPSTTILAALPDGSFRLRFDDGSVVHAAPSGNGYRVEGSSDGTWWLHEAPAGAEGFVLRDGASDDAPERARTTRDRGLGGEAAPTSLLTADGRLFRIVVRGARAPRVELHGTELAGAYLTAIASGGDWALSTTVAGAGLAPGREIWILFAAEILRLDR